MCRGETILSDYSYIPSVVFSSPHVAKVGLDEEDAVERYGDVRVYSNTFRSVQHEQRREHKRLVHTPCATWHSHTM